jgi:plastocyanin
MEARASILIPIITILIIAFSLSMVISPALAKDIIIQEGATSSGGLSITAQTAQTPVGFNPKTTCIKVNDTITWINEDNFPHHVVSGDPSTGVSGQFDEILESNENFSHSFPMPGNVSYFDQLNPDNPELIGGLIEVKELGKECPE